MGHNWPIKFKLDPIGQNMTIKVKIDLIGQNKPIMVKLKPNRKELDDKGKN